MSMTTLGACHALVPGAMLVGDPAVAVERVHTDTRTLRPGDLYLALKGERFDGHAFLAQARAAGAVAAIAEHGLAEAGLPGLQVDDTQVALETLAAGWRAGYAGPLVAVTGSNGKTTVTQMVAAILRAWHGEHALATEGNFNNHIGLPLTLLRLRPSHASAVVELGMNHPGEIARLARVAAPTVALVNNAQREHQEFMASVDAVARENGAAIEALPAHGTAVFPAGDAHAPTWAQLAGARRRLTFATGDAVVPQTDVQTMGVWQQDCWALALRLPSGSASLALHIAGAHNVHNAAAAAAAATAAGAPIDAVVGGLEAFRPVKGRSQLARGRLHGREIALVDDSYNANPDSVRAAIDVLASLPGPRALLLGDMGEVGDQGPAFHAEVGAYAAARGIETLWAAGAASEHAVRAYGADARHYADVPAMVAALGELPAAASVLVKGSRFMAMERVVHALRAPAEG